MNIRICSVTFLALTIVSVSNAQETSNATRGMQEKKPDQRQSVDEKSEQGNDRSHLKQVLQETENNLKRVEVEIDEQNKRLSELSEKFGSTHPDVKAVEAKVGRLNRSRQHTANLIAEIENHLQSYTIPASVLLDKRLEQEILALDSVSQKYGEFHPAVRNQKSIIRDLQELLKQTKEEEVRSAELQIVQKQIAELSQAIERVSRAVSGLSPKEIPSLKALREQYQDLESAVEDFSSSASDFVTEAEKALKEGSRAPEVENNKERAAVLMKQAELLQSEGKVALNTLMEQLSPSVFFGNRSKPGVIHSIGYSNAFTDRLDKMESRLDSMEQLLKEIAAGMPKAGYKD